MKTQGIQIEEASVEWEHAGPVVQVVVVWSCFCR